MAVPKQADSHNGEELSPSSSFDTTAVYGTAPNYPSHQYPQSDPQQHTFSSDMTRYNYSQIASYNDQYKRVPQIDYPQYQEGSIPVTYLQQVPRVTYTEQQGGDSPVNYSQREEVASQVGYSHHQESYSTYNHSAATWSDPALTEPHEAGSGLSGSSHGLPSHVQPTRYSSYPPTSYPPSSNYTPYPASEYSNSWTSSPSPLSNSHVLPPSYPSSSYASTSYLPADHHQYPSYTAVRPSSAQLSTPGSSETMLSPYSTGSLPLSSSPGSTPPVDPSLYNSSGGEEEPLLLSHVRMPNNNPVEPQDRAAQYSHRDQVLDFRNALNLPSASATGPFIPQPMYKPHTTSDRRRYVDEVDLDRPIYFWMENPSECGISLSDALHSRVRRLLDREQTVFEGRGPSVSIRLEWPGYRQWSRQIPTKDFRTPPGPITKAKLAKNVAKCVQRFIMERQNQSLEDESDSRWRIGRSGTGNDFITLDDLILVSMHHVSMGSWQPQLRLSRPLSL